MKFGNKKVVEKYSEKSFLCLLIGIEIILNHLFYNRQEPFIREAGIFVCRF
jgi:hypothetical protein